MGRSQVRTAALSSGVPANITLSAATTHASDRHTRTAALSSGVPANIRHTVSVPPTRLMQVISQLVESLSRGARQLSCDREHEPGRAGTSRPLVGPQHVSRHPASRKPSAEPGRRASPKEKPALSPSTPQYRAETQVLRYAASRRPESYPRPLRGVKPVQKTVSLVAKHSQNRTARKPSAAAPAGASSQSKKTVSLVAKHAGVAIRRVQTARQRAASEHAQPNKAVQ
jgi:hypothetical protein